MPSPVPTPVAAALGIVPAVLSGVRSLPSKAISLPIACVSSALTSLDRTRRGYDDLAERGERLIARLRGTSFDELEDRFEDSLQGTPLAGPYDKVEDALEDVTENVTAFVRSAPAKARKAAGKVEKTVTQSGTPTDLLGSATKTAEDAAGAVTSAATDLKDGAVDAAADLEDGAVDAAAEVKSGATDVKNGAKNAAADLKDGAADAAAEVKSGATDVKSGVTKASADLAADLKEAAADAAADAQDAAAGEAPKGVPTPKATQPDATHVATAATPEVVDTVEAVSAAVGGDVVDRDELPLADFDHLTLGAVRGRMRSLDLAQLVQLRDYEKSKGNRLPIVTMLDNRIAKLATDPSATPSGGDPAAPAAKKPAKRAKKTAGKVSPATANKGASAPTAAFGGLGASVPDKG